MRRSILLPVLAGALAIGAVSVGASVASGAKGNDCSNRNRTGGVAVVGLVNDGTLACFQSNRPGKHTSIGTVSGLAGDASLVGIDYRPATNVLYGVGNAGGVYTIDAASAKATKVATLSVGLSGTSFDIDFNPTVDRLRIVSDTGQNLRVNVADGVAIVDSTLNVPGPPAATATGISGAAYTNNDADPATATTLFDIDSTNDNTVVQAPANAGSISPTGKLGIDAGANVGFDIYAELAGTSTVGNKAFVAVAGASTSTFASVDLLTGRATSIGTLAKPVVDIAIPTAQR